MADITYPDTLPQFTLGKQRKQQQTYRVNDVFAGAPYSEKITDDKPVTWTGSVICKNTLIARSFISFLRIVKNSAPFNMEILTENGFIMHEVRFLKDPDEPTQLTTGIWKYDFTLFSRVLINPDEVIDNDELLVGWLHQSNILDVAINESW